MTTVIKNLLPELPSDNSGKEKSNKPPIDAVDRIADSLVAEYRNPDYRRWYCKIIYDFGPSRVLEWQRRAREGKWPARLFSKYVKDAREHRSLRPPVPDED